MNPAERKSYLDQAVAAFEALAIFCRTANEENLRLRSELIYIKGNALRHLESETILKVFQYDSFELSRSLNADHAILQNEKSGISINCKVRKSHES